MREWGVAANEYGVSFGGDSVLQLHGGNGYRTLYID